MSAIKFFILISSIVFLIFLLNSIFRISDSQIDQAVDSTQKNLYNATLLIAFIGGVLTIFAPCLFPILTAYFAYTFKEKKELTKNTIIFFLGFLSVFIPFGFSLSLLGQLLRVYSTQLTIISGVIIFLFGFMTIFGRGFSFIKTPAMKNHGGWDIYILGITFTIGWAPCVGPILFSILFLAANQPNMIYTALLLLSYAIGMWIPLFAMSYFYDKQRLYKNKWIMGREIKISPKISANTTSLISGILLMFLGTIYIVFKGTQFLNINSLWTQSYFLQSLALSSKLLKSIGDYLGFAVMIAFIILGIYLYKKIINK